jgi:hypothetical protein
MWSSVTRTQGEAQFLVDYYRYASYCIRIRARGVPSQGCYPTAHDDMMAKFLLRLIPSLISESLRNDEKQPLTVNLLQG